MSRPNFKSMDNFNLFVRDYDGDDFIIQNIEEALETLNDSLTFHKIVLEDGYYYGLQFYVEENDDPNEMDNENCRYYFDMFRSVAIRRYNSEVNRIGRLLRRLASAYGFEEVVCSAVFSNGEATYTPVKNNPRAKVLQAVAPYRQ